jgi:hypothetical protein
MSQKNISLKYNINVYKDSVSCFTKKNYSNNEKLPPQEAIEPAPAGPPTSLVKINKNLSLNHKHKLQKNLQNSHLPASQPPESQMNKLSITEY